MTDDPDSTGVQHRDDIPKRGCEYEGDYHGRCDNEATRTRFVRVKHRVENGVYIPTEVRPVFICDEHPHVGHAIPPAEATVVVGRAFLDRDRDPAAIPDGGRGLRDDELDEQITDPGVPRSQGEPWKEAAERLRQKRVLERLQDALDDAQHPQTRFHIRHALQYELHFQEGSR